MKDKDNLFNPLDIPEWVKIEGFQYKVGMQGYIPGVFGCRSGPIVANYALYHDMGHAIDASMRGELYRLECLDFNLRVKSYIEIMGRRYHDPLTKEPTMRENRAYAIQYLIDPTTDLEQCAKLSNDWMPDSCYFKEGEILAHLKECVEKLTLDEVISHWQKACRYIVENKLGEENA